MKVDSRDTTITRRVGARMFHSGVWIGSNPGSYKCSWPLGKVTLGRDHLEIRVFFFVSFEIPWDAIDEIRRTMTGEVQIIHHSGDIPDQIYLRGMLFGGLYELLKDTHERRRQPVAAH